MRNIGNPFYPTYVNVNNGLTARQAVVAMLRGDKAHATLEQATSHMPLELAGERPPGHPHSAWELLEHLRISQRDILDFSRSAEYEPMEWPRDYWPSSPAPASEADWNRSVEACERDLKEFEALLLDENCPLLEPFPWGDGQTLLREALLILSHNSFHIGQLVTVRRALGLWPPTPSRP